MPSTRDDGSLREQGHTWEIMKAARSHDQPSTFRNKQMRELDESPYQNQNFGTHLLVD